MPKLTGSQMGSNHVVKVTWCIGCGQTEGHRPDCLTHPSALHCCHTGCTATRDAGLKTPLWGYNPTLGYLCPDHKGTPC